MTIRVDLKDREEYWNQSTNFPYILLWPKPKVEMIHILPQVKNVHYSQYSPFEGNVSQNNHGSYLCDWSTNFMLNFVDPLTVYTFTISSRSTIIQIPFAFEYSIFFSIAPILYPTWNVFFVR